MSASVSRATKIAATVVLLHLGGLTAVAWSQVVQASLLTGRVFDPSGAVIPGAEVTLRGPFLLDGERLTLTGEAGRFRFPALQPGVFRLTASAAGFAPVERGDILVEVGEDRSVDFVLAVGSRTEQVTVAQRVPAVDIRASAIPTHLDQSLLNNLPVTRELDDLINLAPGVTSNVAFGGTQSSNAIYINGVQTTDPRDQRPLVGLNHNWLEQMEVSALGAGAEYGGFTGVAANAIVKSGGNRFSGLGEYWTTRSGWDGDNSPQTEFSEPREILSFWDTGVQVGGPVVEDRMWFFAGAAFSSLEDSPALSGPGSTQRDARDFITRVDAALTSSVHLEGLYRNGRLDATGVSLGPITLLETTRNERDENQLWNARVTFAQGRTLIEARTGGYARRFASDPRPPNTRLGPSPVFEPGVGITVTSTSFADDDRARADAAVSLTRYAEVLGQPHDLKAGLEFERTTLTSRFGIPGGMLFVEIPPPFMFFNRWDGERDQATSRRGTAYVRDRWSLHERVTLNLGLRLDINRASVPDQGTIFSTNPVSPRAGVAWAVTGDGATVVRAHVGRYHDAILTQQIAALDTSFESPRVGVLVLADGEMVELFRQLPESVNTTIDDGIQHSYVDQYVVGVEREVLTDVSVQVQYVRRNFDRFMGSISTTTEFLSSQVRDPGPDGSIGTADDGELFTIFRAATPEREQFLYTNPDGAFRTYDAIQWIGTKRYSDNWQLQASYTWSRSKATVGNLGRTNAGVNDLGEQSGGLPGVFSSPHGLTNAEGEAPFSLSELKVLGLYRVPAWGGVNVSGIYRYYTGNRWERFFSVSPFDPITVRAEPRGSRQLPAVASFDLRIEKTWSPGDLGTFGLFVDVFNLTNEGTAEAVNGFSGPSFGQPLGWTDPRTVRAGLRFTF